MKMDAGRGRAGYEDLRLPAGKLIARAQWLDTARRENCARDQRGRKKNAQSCIGKQDEVILPGRKLPVKS